MLIRRGGVLLACVLVLLLGASCSQERSVVTIRPYDRFQISYPKSNGCELILKNRSNQDLDVSVYHSDDQRLLRGFRLTSSTTKNIYIEKDASLVVQNDSSEEVRLVYVVKRLPSKKNRVGVVSYDPSTP